VPRSGWVYINGEPEDQELALPFEIIDIRRFEAKDFSDLLNAESLAWNEKLRWDFTASLQIINSCLREKRLSGYALLAESKIRGYCFFFYDGEKGLVGDLFVDPGLPGLDHACQLLDHAVETLLGTPGLRRVEAQLPHYKLEELEAGLHARQFQSYLRRFMSLPLDNLPVGKELPASPSNAADPSLLANLRVMPWEGSFDQAAAELLYHTYQGHVDADINDQYASVSGTTRLVENIVHHEGCGEFLPRLSRLAVHQPTRQLAGILAATCIRPHTAHVPQVAVGVPFQGRGVGSLLMNSAFRDLAREGFKEVTLTVTDQNAGAVRLYERVGFQTFKTFGAFVYKHEERY